MIEYHNNIAIIKNATHWTEWVKKQNKLDVDCSAHLISKKYLKPSDTVLDIGANIGSHSIVYCSQITELGKLYAIDPDPEHCLCLKHNLPSWVDIMEIAISDTIGSIGYKQYSNTGCNRCVLDNYDFIVQTTTIDECFTNEKIDFIKMDIEGYELKALVGAKHIIQTYRPYICLESNQSALQQAGTSQEELYRYISSIGYGFEPLLHNEELYDAQPDIICYPLLNS